LLRLLSFSLANKSIFFQGSTLLIAPQGVAVLDMHWNRVDNKKDTMVVQLAWAAMALVVVIQEQLEVDSRQVVMVHAQSLLQVLVQEQEDVDENQQFVVLDGG
jgi:hypothetical protein